MPGDWECKETDHSHAGFTQLQCETAQAARDCRSRSETDPAGTLPVKNIGLHALRRLFHLSPLQRPQSQPALHSEPGNL